MVNRENATKSSTENKEPSLEAILRKLRALTPAIQAEGVTRLAVFGSRARGDARPDSDLDILIDTIPRIADAPVFDLFKVMHLIEDNIGLPTQITMTSELNSRVSERIEDDLIEVF